MSKKMYALLLPVLVLAALAIGAGSAQAAFHFYECKHEATATHKWIDSACSVESATNVGEYEKHQLAFGGAKTRVKTFGVLTLTDGSIVVKCFVDDHGKVWNVASETTSGKDEIQFFENYECESSACTGTIAIAAEGLPWATELVAGPKDKISGIQIKLSCSSPEFSETFTGTLEPNWINGTQKNGGTSFVEFLGATSGKLKGKVSGEATVTGKDFVIGVEHAEQILAFNP